MPIEIIVETGEIVANANSFISIGDVRNYCENRGVTLSDTDDDVARQLIIAADYIGQNSEKFAGEKVSPSQPLDWPRCERAPFTSKLFPVETSSGLVIQPDEIPEQLRRAQCWLVIYQQNGISLTDTVSPSDFVIRETIGPITTEYSDPSLLSSSPKLPMYDAALSSLFGSGFGGGGMFVKRV